MQPNDRGLQQHSKRLVSQDFIIVKLLSMWSLVIIAGTEIVRHSAVREVAVEAFSVCCIGHKDSFGNKTTKLKSVHFSAVTRHQEKTASCFVC